MYSVYDTNTNEELYRISYINPQTFQNTMQEKITKVVNGQIVEITNTRNIAYREVTENE